MLLVKGSVTALPFSFEMIHQVNEAKLNSIFGKEAVKFYRISVNIYRVYKKTSSIHEIYKSKNLVLIKEKI